MMMICMIMRVKICRCFMNERTTDWMSLHSKKYYLIYVRTTNLMKLNIHLKAIKLPCSCTENETKYKLLILIFLSTFSNCSHFIKLSYTSKLHICWHVGTILLFMFVVTCINAHIKHTFEIETYTTCAKYTYFHQDWSKHLLCDFSIAIYKIALS